MTKSFRHLILISFAVFTIGCTNAFGQKEKKLEDSGNKPHWVNWSRGKDFKRLGKGRANKIKMDKKDDVYLFVATAREVANNGSTDLFSLDDTRRVAALNASFEFASILKQEIDASVKNDVTISEEARDRLFTRTEKMKTAANFTGFTRVASYWQKVLEKETNKVYWQVYFLYSINAKTVKENLSKAMEQLSISDKTSAVMAAIETAAEEADDGDLGDF
ncbi:hypothetical protein [Marinoscillum furvescens]|uniref:DUF4142 domain-containing protein n=1 Tax=Marinoscillum furvescens DSM 4134 TaxID=1122208 RepID=A0A3D9KYA6_MARFU|nr:hypothetical protein [Marinoscillum furvescens]RED92462.1 hypothetical protein C7460_13030 [Marinoscillum furvescens DSM 4134]